MDTAHRDHLIAMLPKTEYGRAFFDWIDEEIAIIEAVEESSDKISPDPLIEDFRVKRGMKIAFKRVKRKPQEIIENQKGG